MAYQSLYRRYRPQRFAEVRGQDHLVAALRNAVREGRVGHAYLFSGPRGTGKTTTARILAKALNCPNVVDGEPCGTCESCVSIQHGSSFDVHELDAASNNKVEEIRDLISKAALGTPGRTKVYILDEVHMLTTAASNALLKTLEEPPEHVVFVLATTDPQKVLATIRSRCQHFDVHLLTADELTELAEFIIDDAKLEVPEGTVPYVVTAGAGSARDMESALDQVVAAGGLPDGGELLNELVDALADRDVGRTLLAVDRAVQNGRAPRALGEELIGRLRDVFLASMNADPDRLPDYDQARVSEQAKKLGPRGATRALEALGEAFVGIQDAPDPRITLEVALVRITRPEADISPAALLERLERLEQGAPPVPVPASARSAPTAEAPPAAPPVAPPKSTPDPAPSQDAAPDAPPRGGSTRPADLARESLSQTRGQRSTGPKATPKPSRPAKRAETPAPAPKPTAPDAVPAPAAEAEAPPAAAPVAGGLPSRDELTLAWGDSILASLPNKAKARFAGGRWVAVDSAAAYALPNAHHRDRCEACRTDVEAALETHFGQPVPIRLVIDDAEDESPSTSSGSSGARPVEAPAEEHEVDVSQLTDATDAGASSLERINDLFPGAELVEGD